MNTSIVEAIAATLEAARRPGAEIIRLHREAHRIHREFADEGISVEQIAQALLLESQRSPPVSIEI